jgi:hypothetical protein
MELQIVHFDPFGDGITALYKEGKLETWGDFYHDKIDDYIRGYIEGVKATGTEVSTINYYGATEDLEETMEPLEELGGYIIGIEIVTREGLSDGV